MSALDAGVRVDAAFSGLFRLCLQVTVPDGLDRKRSRQIKLKALNSPRPICSLAHNQSRCWRNECRPSSCTRTYHQGFSETCHTSWRTVLRDVVAL